jgi:hypothetical protein
MHTFAERVHVLQTDAERLTQYRRALPPEARSRPSACTQWQVQNVVAHLIGVAESYDGNVCRDLQGDASPCILPWQLGAWWSTITGSWRAALPSGAGAFERI